MAKRDFYDILGVSRDASAGQIKSAYRKLAREYHPDVNKASDASEKFTEATEAYEVLSDSKKRKLYDQFGHAGLGGAAGPGPAGARVYTHAAGAGARGRGFNVSDFFEGSSGFMGMSLDEILQSLGGGRTARKARGRRRPAKGADLEYPVTLDFLQAVKGVKTTIRIQREGGGTDATETIEVKIPAGVREGQKVRIRGKGQAAPRGQAGDLYIIVHITPHAYFRREGADVIVEAPVSITEAALGAKVDVPTIDGMTTVTIPPGTSGSQKLRLKGKGIAAGNGRGDQYVVLKIVVPKALSPQAQELLEKLAQVDDSDPRKDAPWT
ncbi:MAG: DnaJ C-terminal domain-containing protein [Planctomycetota bacterium]|jgi:molecular chaperone DnaJ